MEVAPHYKLLTLPTLLTLLTLFSLLTRPSQLAEFSRSEFNPELFSHSAYVKFFCDIRDKSTIFNILRQNETIFDIGNG